MQLFYPHKVVLIVFSSKEKAEIKVHSLQNSLPGAGRISSLFKYTSAEEMILNVPLCFIIHPDSQIVSDCHIQLAKLT